MPAMSNVRRAVIDVGTNSVKLLVADIEGHRVIPVLEDSRQTRLGQGFYETHRLQPEAIQRTAAAVAKFMEICSSHRVASIRVIATSAARDAINPRDLTEALGRASGLGVEIISGEQEADWAFQGVTSHGELAKHPLLLLDVGGGSTEFILGHGEQKHFRHSFPLGTVRLMEKIPHGDPPKPVELDQTRAWLRTFLHTQVRPMLEPKLRDEVRQSHGDNVLLVGTGGTTTIMARIEARLEDYDRARIEATRLSLPQVKAQVQRLWSMPLAERQKIVGLPPKRADVILTGVVIYEVVMEELGFTELRVSTRGLRFAAVMSDK